MTKFDEFLKTKELKTEFGKLDADKQLELQNEYNVLLKTEYEAALSNKATKEDLDAYKTEIGNSNNSVIKAVESLGLAVKAMAEKQGKNAEDMTKPELITMFEKSAAEAKEGSNFSKKKAVVKAKAIFDEVNKSAALMTTGNITGAGGSGTGGAQGFSQLFGNYIDNQIYAAPIQISSILDDVSVVTQTGTENVYYTERKTPEGAVQTLSEGSAKPLADANWVTSVVNTKEIAVMWKISHRMLFHASASVQDFRQYAQLLVEQFIPDEVLNGDSSITTGNQDNFDGVITAASSWTTGGALSETVLFPNVYDVIVAMSTTIRTAGYKGQIVARVNPGEELALLSGQKTTYGEYTFPPFVSPDGSKIKDVLLKYDPSIPAGKILVGVLSNYKVVIAENVMYFETDSNVDDFEKNMRSRKLEAFVAGYLPSQLKPSIIYGDIATIKADILTT